MTEPLPTNAIIASLRLLAGSEPDAAIRLELFESANNLEQVLARTHFAHAPTRDQMQAALWGAQEGLASRLDEILRTCVVTSEIVTATQRQLAESSARLGKLEVAYEELQEWVVRITAQLDRRPSVEMAEQLIEEFRDIQKIVWGLQSAKGDGQ